MCRLEKTNTVVAVKKLIYNKDYKTRELMIHREMHHQNIVRMRDAYFVKQKKKSGKSQVNIVMDYIPFNVHRTIKHFRDLKQKTHPLLVKLYTYQLLRGLNYLAKKNVMHRDIKP